MKFTLSKNPPNRKIIIFSLLGLALLIIILLLVSRTKNNNNQLTKPGSTVLNPVFLSDKEKADPYINVKPETKIQVLKRDAAGRVVLYKVINSDSDIVTDLNQVKPIVPDVKK